MADINATDVDRRVRTILNDKTKARWSEQDLTMWTNDGVEAIRAIRPDARLASNALRTVTALGSEMIGTLTLDVKFREPLVDFVLTRCFQQKAEEKENLERAHEHDGRFSKMIKMV